MARIPEHIIENVRQVAEQQSHVAVYVAKSPSKDPISYPHSSTLQPSESEVTPDEQKIS